MALRAAGVVACGRAMAVARGRNSGGVAQVAYVSR